MRLKGGKVPVEVDGPLVIYIIVSGPFIGALGYVLNYTYGSHGWSALAAQHIHLD